MKIFFTFCLYLLLNNVLISQVSQNCVTCFISSDGNQGRGYKTGGLLITGARTGIPAGNLASNYTLIHGIYPFELLNLSTPIREEFQDQATSMVYPNPANHQITVQQMGHMGQEKSIQLIDPIGRIVYQNTTKTPNETISTRDIPAGLYLMLVSDQKIKETFPIQIIH